jgi:hypothetical protein
LVEQALGRPRNLKVSLRSDALQLAHVFPQHLPVFFAA